MICWSVPCNTGFWSPVQLYYIYNPFELMQGQIKWRVCWASIIFTCVPQSNIMCNNWCFRNLQLLRFWQPCTLLWCHMHLLITTWIKSYQGASSADTECSKPANIANSSNSELGICPTAFNFEGLSPVFKGLIETSPDVGASLTCCFICECQ